MTFRCLSENPTLDATRMNACAESHPSERESDESLPLTPERAQDLRAQMRAFLEECAQVEASLLPLKEAVSKGLQSPRPPNIFEQP